MAVMVVMVVVLEDKKSEGLRLVFFSLFLSFFHVLTYNGNLLGFLERWVVVGGSGFSPLGLL